MKKVVIYDSTLRDGAQGRNISYTVSDKIKIVKKLDLLGVDFIEAGNPGSNPKDHEFFEQIKNVKLQTSKIVAFGSTRRPDTDVKDDHNMQAILAADTEYVTIFGKTWDFQITNIIKTTLDENIGMIKDSIEYLVSLGKKVIFDAEHFFDGYKNNKEYAMKTVIEACHSGAVEVCLCDTKGGSFPDEIERMTKEVLSRVKCAVGIHCHDDNGMGVALSIAAVLAGATSVQGTFNGIGERCGNANLTTIIPNLQLLKDYSCIPSENLSNLYDTAHYISEVSNLALPYQAPFVGISSFSHKAGMHSDAVRKDTSSYELFDPGLVGNERKILMSEVAGRSAVLKLINKIDPSIEKNDDKTKEIMKKLKDMEFEGYQYETAEASFELLIRKILGMYKPSFELIEFKVTVNEPSVNNVNSYAMIKIKVIDQYEITAAEGDGPVDALDGALRKALGKFYPVINDIKLTDYKVRVLDSENATAAKVRVLIESSDKKSSWNTIGVSADIIEASWLALIDSIEYYICQKGKE
ncbi:MAG: citramalate synthase [Clostridia bacterium]|nr:citramalate synthase [Clostridia bacterium]